MATPNSQPPAQKGNAVTWVIIILLIILIVAVAWYFMTRTTANTNGNTNRNTNANVTVNRTANTNVTRNSNVNATANANVSSNANATSNTNGTTAASNYTVTASGPTPSTVRVAAGTRVNWRNESGRAIYIAPNDHPTHLKYQGVWDDDGTGRTEDGETYSFTFSQAGTYLWHDHLHPEVTGTVIVE